MYAHPEEEDHHRASALLLRLPEVVAYHPVAAAALAVEVVVAASLADLLREVEASFPPSSHYLEEVALLPFLLPDVVAVGGARVALALMAFHLDDVEDHPEEVAYHYPQEEEDVGDHYYYRQEEEGSCSSYVRYPPQKNFQPGAVDLH
jgi:hypothetical protein